jgi:predicted O-methyltransferase YrrM
VYSEKEIIKEYGPEAPVPISQYKLEFERLLDIYKKFKPSKVLEVGTHYGGTLYHWAQNARKDALIVSVDDFHLNETMYKDWETNGCTIFPIKGKSQDNKILWLAESFGPYDWIFIDGGHSYEEVKADWENFSSMASENATIVFHDILPHPNSDVSKVWHDIKRKEYGTFELVEDYNQTGCGIGVVFL